MSTQEEPEFSDQDLAYISREYRTLEQLCAGRGEQVDEVRSQIAYGDLPRPTYVLADGTEMFPPDYFAMVDGAGGVAGLRGYFDQRHGSATSALGLAGVDTEENWRGYLSGEFGACLREVSPEAIVEKSTLIAQIDTLTAVPAVGDETWRGQLGAAVDDLDEIERPFTDYDRQRWGVTSRDSHITAVRARFLSGP